MKIHNHLPRFVECMRRWRTPPGLDDFVREYYAPLEAQIGILFDDGGAASFHEELFGLNWELYREEALRLDPGAEETRLRANLARVEGLLGLALEGELVLWSAFTLMDGYARFDRGSHRVFLAVDESHGRGAYIDVLTTHELAHVARESRPSVWRGFGLESLHLGMSHHDFTENLPVIEHLFGEGFSCAISELLQPGEDPWHYAYQTRDSLAFVIEHGPAVDRVVREELLDPRGDYGRLYNPRLYGPGMPAFSHYVWAWQWVRRLLEERAEGDPRRLLAVCSAEFRDSALRFELRELSR